MSRRRLAAVAFFVVMAGMVGPAALAGDNHSDVFSFTTSSTGSRLITLHTAPTFAGSNVLSGSGNVSSTGGGVTQVTELAVTGANWTVTAQLCGPAGQFNATPVTLTAALTAGSTCTGQYANQFAGFDSSGNYLTNIDGSRVTAATAINNGGTAVAPFSTGVASTTASAPMSSPVTVLSTPESSNNSYSATYQTTTTVTVANVAQNATWVGYWVTTLQP